MHILKYLKYITLLICFGFAIAISQKSYAASTVHLMELLEVEDKLLENLNGFVEKLKNKLLLVETFLETAKAANNLMNADCEEYLGNPINSFILMLSLHRNWSKWVHYASNPSQAELEHIEQAHLMRKFLPTARDLERACQGIDDLVHVYDLKPSDLATGTLAGVPQSETALSARDCYAMAEFCVAHQKDDWAEVWFNVSLDKINNQKEGKLKVQEYDLTSFRVHRSWGALLMKQKRIIEGLDQLQQKPKGFLGYHFHRMMTVKQNCRAVFEKPCHLHCHYNTDTPFLRIDPLKVEVVSLDPYLAVYRESEPGLRQS